VTIYGKTVGFMPVWLMVSWYFCCFIFRRAFNLLNYVTFIDSLHFRRPGTEKPLSDGDDDAQWHS